MKTKYYYFLGWLCCRHEVIGLVVPQNSTEASPFTYDCNPAANNTFQSFFALSFIKDSGNTTDDALVAIHTTISSAYDMVAGRACDACSRRIVDTILVAPPSGLDSGFDNNNTDSRVVVQITVEQAGNCTAAIDTMEGTVYETNSSLFETVCYDASPAAGLCCCVDDSTMSLGNFDKSPKMPPSLPISASVLLDELKKDMTYLSAMEEVRNLGLWEIQLQLPLIIKGSDNSRLRRGLQAACSNPEAIFELIRDSYNELAFQMCDPLQRRITHGFVECDVVSCDEADLVSAAATLTVSGTGTDEPTEGNALFATLADKSKALGCSPSRVRRDLSRKDDSEARNLGIQTILCNPQAQDSREPCRDEFEQLFSENLSQSSLAADIDRLEILFEPQCICAEEAKQVYEENGITFLPIKEKSCRHRLLVEKENIRGMRTKSSRAVCGLFPCD